MKINYCLPIIEADQAKVLEIIRANNEDYSYFEVWLDYVNEVDDSFIKQLVDLAEEKLILLFRRQNLEAIKMPIEQRFSILESAQGAPILVDLDITTQAAELGYIGQHDLNIKTIVSYHDYQETPNAVRLETIIATMDGYRPAIYKLAGLCQNSDDALRLLQQLLKFKAKGQAAIVLGMGEPGLVTRIFGTLWGNAMAFAPLDQAGQSAPGQLTRQQLENIFKELQG